MSAATTTHRRSGGGGAGGEGGKGWGWARPPLGRIRMGRPPTWFEAGKWWKRGKKKREKMRAVRTHFCWTCPAFALKGPKGKEKAMGKQWGVEKKILVAAGWMR